MSGEGRARGRRRGLHSCPEAVQQKTDHKYERTAVGRSAAFSVLPCSSAYTPHSDHSSLPHHPYYPRSSPRTGRAADNDRSRFNRSCPYQIFGLPSMPTIRSSKASEPRRGLDRLHLEPDTYQIEKVGELHGLLPSTLGTGSQRFHNNLLPHVGAHDHHLRAIQ